MNDYGWGLTPVHGLSTYEGFVDPDRYDPKRPLFYIKLCRNK